VKRVTLFGQWWAGDGLEDYAEETHLDPEYLRINGVETHPPVAFDEVEATMGTGRLSPIFIRPVLNALELATPRMFETFAADTVPILPPNIRHARALYGDAIGPLCLPEDPAETIVAMLDQYADYVAFAREVAERLARNHSYEVRLSELIEIGLS
jgi:hypothetical protein